MEYYYEVYTSRGALVISTRNFDMALHAYANAGKKDGWPYFTHKVLPSPAIPGYPDAFLSPLAD